jgi:hypothetical protein
MSSIKILNFLSNPLCFRRKNIKKLNNIYYDGKKSVLSGYDLQQLVCGRKISYEWIENDPSKMLIIVHDKQWNISTSKWDEMAKWISEFYIEDQLKNKILDSRQEHGTIIVDLDIYPLYDE